MPDPLYYGQQEYGTGDVDALALKRYGGRVIEAFETALVFGKHVTTVPAERGHTSVQFPANAKAEAVEHTPGTLLPGSNQPEAEERLVLLDNYELTSTIWESTIHNWSRHFNTLESYGATHGAGVARKVDKRLASQIAVGARMEAEGTGADQFPAGNVIAAGASTLANAYPVSLAGSRALQDHMGEMAQNFEDKDVPEGMRFAFLPPYLKRVLLQDKTLTSRDYTDLNSGITRTLVEVEGFMIESTNNMPSTDWSSETSLKSHYQHDFSITAALFIGGPDAVGQMDVLNGVQPIGPKWYEEYRSYLVGAAAWQGCKWLRPESCGEIQLCTSGNEDTISR